MNAQTLAGLVLPTFVVIGAAKSGSSTLYRHLDAHPEVFMSSPKEPDFFVAEGRWAKGVEWCGGLFEKAADAKARGEASTNDTAHPVHENVVRRMHAVVPDARLVYVLRLPLERAVSLLRQ